MKITVVQIVPTLRDGGAEALLRNLVPLLAAEPDLDVHVVSVYDSRLDISEKAALGASLHEVGRNGRIDLAFAPRLVSTLRRLKPHITHSHIHSGKFAGRLASIAAGVPKIVFTEHGDEARGVVHWTMNRALNMRTSRFVVFTEDERQRYAASQHISPSRIEVIANGIPLPQEIDVAKMRAEIGVLSGEFVIGSAARLVSQKNQQLILRSVAALIASGRRNIRLLLIGQGPDEGALRSLTAELGLEKNVLFLGYRTDARRLIGACDVLALSSRWEKMPLVMGEAMLSRVPTVSTPWTGVSTFLVDNLTGYIATDWSVEGFSMALSRSINNPVERLEIAARGCEEASERFNLQRAVRLHANLYRDLVRSD